MHCARPIPGPRCCSGTVEKFSGDQERALLVPFVILFPPRFRLCASGHIRKGCERRRKLRSFRARRRRSILWKDIRRRFQETRIVFRLGKLVIDTAVHELPSNFPAPPRPGILAVLLSSTAIKTYLPERSMLTTSAAVLPRNAFVITAGVCHYAPRSETCSLRHVTYESETPRFIKLFS